MGALYKYCQQRANFLKRYVKNYVEIWEHDWDIRVKTDPRIKAFCKDPLKPRDALFGGRTNAAKLYHNCVGDEKIKYYDVTSLEPFVQKTCKYPKGAPTIIRENFTNKNDYFGLVHCRILPPWNSDSLFYQLASTKSYYMYCAPNVLKIDKKVVHTVMLNVC